MFMVCLQRRLEIMFAYSVLQKTHSRACQAAFFHWARMTKCSVGFKSSFYFYPKERERERERERESGKREGEKRSLACPRENETWDAGLYALAIRGCSARRECNLNSVFYIFVGRVTQPLKFFPIFLLYSVDILWENKAWQREFVLRDLVSGKQ